MKVKCIGNTGTDVCEQTLNAKFGSRQTKLPIEIGDMYSVYGQLLYKGILEYLIVGSGENFPSWYPAELFTMIDSELPMSWHFRYLDDDNIGAIWGYEELVKNNRYLYDLIDRERYAIEIFLKRKKEIDEYFGDGLFPVT